uniref:Calmodulin n=1 Tax=Schistocephalus solidus TaxID=70667 RepID=A0A183TRI5_SCHSO
LMDSLDVDKSGKVSAEEVLTGLKGSGLDLESIKDFIASHDKDNDGLLNRDELRAYFKELGY